MDTVESQASSQAGSSDNPPPYYIARPVPCANSWSNYPGLNRYRYHKGPEANITINYRSNPTALHSDCLWSARVVFHTKDLAYLMHHGLSLTQENVDFRKNHCRLLRDRENQPWTHARYFEAKDNNTLESHWSAKITVFGNDYGTLGAFRLQDLSLETVNSAAAYDNRNRPLYKFSVMDPDSNFNAIFDDLPLPGMWPWPKAPEREVEEGDEARKEKKRWSFRGALGFKKGDA